MDGGRQVGGERRGSMGEGEEGIEYIPLGRSDDFLTL